MAFRPFTCSDCGHRMRLFGDRCTNCFSYKAPHQRAGRWLTALGTVVLLALGGVALAI